MIVSNLRNAKSYSDADYDLSETTAQRIKSGEVVLDDDRTIVSDLPVFCKVNNCRMINVSLIFVIQII